MNAQTTQIPFSLEAWQELVVEKKTHRVQMINEDSSTVREGRIADTNFIVDGIPFILFVCVEKDGNNSARRVKMDGAIHSQLDLRLVIAPNPPASLGWVAINRRIADGFLESQFWKTKENVQNVGARWETIAVYEVFEGEGL